MLAVEVVELQPVSDGAQMRQVVVYCVGQIHHQRLQLTHLVALVTDSRREPVALPLSQRESTLHSEVRQPQPDTHPQA
jgi:hypothetical protein